MTRGRRGRGATCSMALSQEGRAGLAVAGHSARPGAGPGWGPPEGPAQPAATGTDVRQEGWGPAGQPCLSPVATLGSEKPPPVGRSWQDTGTRRPRAWVGTCCLRLGRFQWPV